MRLSDLVNGKKRKKGSGFSYTPSVSDPAQNYDTYLKRNPMDKFEANKFVFPISDPMVDPYQRLRLQDPLRAPLPIIYDENKDPNKGVPQATLDAYRKLPNGQALIDDGQVFKSKRSEEEIDRQLAQVGKDRPSNVENLGILPRLLGMASAPGSHWMGAARGMREDKSNKGAQDITNYFSGKAKEFDKKADKLEKMDEYERQLSNWGADPRLLQTAAVNADNFLLGLIGEADRLGQNLGTVEDKNGILADRIKRNVKAAERLEDTYGASEELTRTGWERDGSFKRGTYATLTDAMQDPTNALGFGSASGAKMATREFASKALGESSEMAIRKLSESAAKVGGEGLVNAGVGVVKSGVDDAVLKSIGRQFAKRGGKELGQDSIKVLSKMDKPSTVFDIASKVTGTNPQRFTSEVQRLAKWYGRDGAEILGKNASKIGGEGLDTIDQRIIDQALRRANDDFGAYGLDIPFVGETRNLPGSRQVGTAISRLMEADLINNPLTRKMGDFTPSRYGSMSDILHPFRAAKGRIAKPLEAQIMARNAARKRIAAEVAAHGANEAINEAKKGVDDVSIPNASRWIPPRRPEPPTPRGGFDPNPNTPIPSGSPNVINLDDTRNLFDARGLPIRRSGADGFDPDNLRGIRDITQEEAAHLFGREQDPNFWNDMDELLGRTLPPPTRQSGILGERLQSNYPADLLDSGGVFYEGHGEYAPVIAMPDGRIFDVRDDLSSGAYAYAFRSGRLADHSARDLFRDPTINSAPALIESLPSDFTPARDTGNPFSYGGGRELYAFSDDAPDDVARRGLPTDTDIEVIGGATDRYNRGEGSNLYRLIERLDVREKSYDKDMENWLPKQIHYWDDTEKKWKPTVASTKMDDMADAPDMESINEWTQKVMQGDGSTLPDDWFDLNIAAEDGGMPAPMRQLAREFYIVNGGTNVFGGTNVSLVERRALDEKFVNLVWALNHGGEALERYNRDYADNALRYIGNGSDPDKLEFLGDGIYHQTHPWFTDSTLESFYAPAVTGRLEVEIDPKTKEAYVRWMGVGGGETYSVDHSKAGKSVYSLMQRAARVLREKYPDYTVTNSPGNGVVDRMYRMLGFTDTASTKGNGSLQYNRPGTEAFTAAPLGAAAGIEEDEEGNTTINPLAAAAGVAGLAVGGRAAGNYLKNRGGFEEIAGLAQKYLPAGITDDGFDEAKVVFAANDKAPKPLLEADGTTLTQEGKVFLKVVRDQRKRADTMAQSAKEKLLGLNPIENYQPSRLPNTGRERTAQKVQAKLYGDQKRSLPEVIAGLVSGDRGFKAPARDFETLVDESRQNMYGAIDATEGTFQQDKLFENPYARGKAGVLTETNPYKAFEQVETEQGILKAQEDLLYELGSTYGKRVSEKSAKEIPDAMLVKMQDGTTFLMPDAETAARVNDLAQTGNIIGTHKGLIGKMEGVGRYLTPLMTVARPAFTAINTLGNLALMGRSGYGKAMPEAARLQGALISAKGIVDDIPDAADRELLKLAEENGVINALDLNPSTVFDPTHDSPLLRTPAAGTAMRMNQRVNALSENNARLAVFLEEMARNGGDAPAARQRVDDILFNYDVNALTKPEQELRKAAPFYTFSRRNFPATTEYYAKHPTRLANLNRIATNFGDEENENQAEMKRQMPPYMRDQIMFKSGDQMRNVRLPDADVLRLADTAERVASRRDMAAPLGIARDLVAPQYSILNSLISGYNDRGNEVAVGGDTDLSTIANEVVAQTPLLGAVINAVAKQDKEEVKGGDPKALERFIRNQGWWGTDGMFPTTDYNPASWERTNAIMSNEEMKDYKTSLMKPNALESFLGKEGMNIPETSTMKQLAEGRVHSLRQQNEMENDTARAEYDEDERVKRMIYNYERYQQSGKKSYLSRLSKNSKPLTKEQWQMLKEADPEAYDYYYGRYGWRTKDKTLLDLLEQL